MKKVFFFVGLLCVLVGCSQQQSDPRVDQLQSTVSQLQATVTQLQTTISQLQNSDSQLSEEVMQLSTLSSNEYSAFRENLVYVSDAEQKAEKSVDALTTDYSTLSSPYGGAGIFPNTKGYSNLKTPYGTLLVVTESVEQYLDGYKIHLKIGNPTSAAFRGFSLICSTSDSIGTSRSITNDVTDNLSAGCWNNVEFVLAPATMEEVRNASVSIQLNQVFLTPPASTPASE